KPMAGSLADVFEIFRLAEENKTPIFSSSALRFSAGYQKMRNEKPLGEILGCNVWAPCILNPDARQPDLFWYGVHGSEILFTMMGLGCQTVSRTQTEGGEFVVGVWDGGRIGAFRGIRSGKPDYGAIVFGTEGNGDAGGFDGYKPLVKATCEFFLTNRPPFDSAETIEIFAFMEAADWSKARGGLPVSIAEVIEKAKTETAIPVNLHLSSSGALQLDGKAVELVRLKETLDALAAETPNSRVKVILHADKNTPHETVLAVCNNLGKAILANFLYENK
ncbi:MAG: biopolymer transporter ExbD, partial [Planctomycetaceae bacterium]|nr:biopolymer transporter ExbD [Planctomycetaceae bacterium]